MVKNYSNCFENSVDFKQFMKIICWFIKIVSENVFVKYLSIITDNINRKIRKNKFIQILTY